MDVRASVIVPSYNAASTIERCLRSLERQEDKRFEIIVVDSSSDGTAEIVEGGFPAVRLIRAGTRKFPGDARNLGAEHARGSIFAFLDADCFVEPDWMRTLLRSHNGTVRAVSGSLLNANPESYVGWAHYFLDFTAWLPIDPERRGDDIAGACLSVHRSLFERHGPFAEGVYSSDTAFCWRLRGAGCELRFVPALRVHHRNISAIGRLLASKMTRGRAFASLRAREQQFSLGRRLVYAAGVSALPAITLTRISRRVEAVPGLSRRFWLVSPLVLLAAGAWSMGEAAGYLFMRRSAG
jgi:GT2 family glycosyltransferase